MATVVVLLELWEWGWVRGAQQRKRAPPPLTNAMTRERVISARKSWINLDQLDQLDQVLDQ